MCVASAAAWGHGDVWLRQLLRVMFGKPKSVLMSVVPVATKGHTNARVLGVPHVAMLVSEGYAAARTTQIWVICAATWEHGVVQLGLSRGHVWVYGLTSARISVDVHGPC